MRARLKPIRLLGDALDRIRAFPDGARKQAGVEPHKLQLGFAASDVKPMASIGPGVEEVRIRDEAGAFRIFYVARFVDASYVLHAFQKKTQRTAQRDLDLAAQRLKQIRPANPETPR